MALVATTMELVSAAGFVILGAVVSSYGFFRAAGGTIYDRLGGRIITVFGALLIIVGLWMRGGVK